MTDGLYHEPQGIKLVTGELVRTPASPGEGLFVMVPSFGDQHVYGPCGWSPPPNGRLPVKGSSCLVAFDENNNAWVVSLEASSVTGAELVSALPASPYDGQIIVYQNAAMAAAGVAWRLRYRAASASAHKWEFLGGSPMASEVATQESTVSAAFADLTTVGPSVTLPLAGDYEVLFGGKIVVGAVGVYGQIGIKVGAAAAGSSVATGKAVEQITSPFRRIRLTEVAAETLVKLQYLASESKTVSFLERVLSVQPVRVG